MAPGSDEPEPRHAGWGFPVAARKAHFFEQGVSVSLCGNWLFTGPVEPQTGNSSPDDCKVCLKKLGKGN